MIMVCLDVSNASEYWPGGRTALPHCTCSVNVNVPLKGDWALAVVARTQPANITPRKSLKLALYRT
jgi:hypothetical protein